jgi:hypothetical protein
MMRVHTRSIFVRFTDHGPARIGTASGSGEHQQQDGIGFGGGHHVVQDVGQFAVVSTFTSLPQGSPDQSSG